MFNLSTYSGNTIDEIYPSLGITVLLNITCIFLTDFMLDLILFSHTYGGFFSNLMTQKAWVSGGLNSPPRTHRDTPTHTPTHKHTHTHTHTHTLNPCFVRAWNLRQWFPFTTSNVISWTVCTLQTRKRILMTSIKLKMISSYKFNYQEDLMVKDSTSYHI